jgi:L-serine dehydratase
MGLFGGFLGWEAYDERLVQSEMHLGAAGIKFKINIIDIQADHPNTYKITLTNPWETRQVIAISTGGGMIEMIEIDGVQVSLAGDKFVTLIYTSDLQKLNNYLQQSGILEDSEIHTEKGGFIALTSQAFFDKTLLEELKSIEGVKHIKQINPVLPILSGKNQTVPFITCDEMLAYNKDKNLSLWELAVRYESIRGNITSVEVLSKMDEIRIILKNAVETGLKGTEFEDRILGPQSLKFKSMMEDKKLIDGNVLNRIIMVCICHYGGKEFHGCDSGCANRWIMWRDAWSSIGCVRFDGSFR